MHSITDQSAYSNFKQIVKTPCLLSLTIPAVSENLLLIVGDQIPHHFVGEELSCNYLGGSVLRNPPAHILFLKMIENIAGMVTPLQASNVPPNY